MSHAGFAILIVAFGAGLGIARGRIATSRALGAAIALGALAVSVHLFELLIQ